MKINVSYKKLSNGQIVARVEVMESGDFPTVKIFDDNDDYPTKWSRLGGGINGEDYIIITAEAAVIEKEVTGEILVLARYIREWRKISVPADYDLEV